MCKQVTVCPGKQGVKAGSALAHPGQCYSSGQGFPGRVSAAGTHPLSRLQPQGDASKVEISYQGLFWTVLEQPNQEEDGRVGLNEL